MKLQFDKNALNAAVGQRCLDKPEDFGITISCKDIQVERIALVGFHAMTRDDGRLWSSLDRDLLRTALSSFQLNPHLQLSPTVTADLINADIDHGGVDFFDVTGKYDLLLMGNIYIPGNGEKMHSGFSWIDTLGGPDCFVSPQCSHVRQWAQKAEELSAKIIFTISCGSSLDVDYFGRYGDYNVLQHENDENRKTGLAVHKNFTL